MKQDWQSWLFSHESIDSSGNDVNLSENVWCDRDQYEILDMDAGKAN